MGAICPLARGSASTICGFVWILNHYDLGTSGLICCGCFWALFRFCNDDGSHLSVLGRNATTAGDSSFDRRTWTGIWLLGCGGDMLGNDTFPCGHYALWVSLAPEVGVYEK